MFHGSAPYQNPMVDYHAVLRDIYPGIPDYIINDVVQMVLEVSPGDTDELKLENMVNMLDSYGAWGPAPTSNTENTSNEHYEKLMEIFPDADPAYISAFCQEQPVGFNIDEAAQKLCTDGYDKIEVDPLVIWEQLKDALPNADPSYLKRKAQKFALAPRQDLDNFLQAAIENNDYPTMKEYLQKKKQHDELAVYKQFNVDRYLEVIPNPEERFSNPNRVLPLDENSSEDDVRFALTFLYNNYSFVRKKHIDLLFKWKKKNLVEICERLDKMGKTMKRPRPQEESVDTKNESLLQEVAYLRNRKTIKWVLKHRNKAYQAQKEEARRYGLLQDCQCCLEEGLIPEECYFCRKSCVFCKDCVKKGAEIAVGNGNLTFPCLANCDSEFSFQTLQMVLPSKMIEKLVQKVASEEAKKANIDGLETCPFCDFAMIVPENEKIFKCINQDCLLESCRECRHKSHIPLRCSEIEYDEDVRRRTYVENKMTEALTRTCHSCNMVFVKENGCNKMTCRCGAKQCYLCGAVVKGYEHFGTNRCALFTNDNEINLQRVLSSAQSAKAELGNVQIKFDPSKGIENYF